MKINNMSGIETYLIITGHLAALYFLGHHVETVRLLEGASLVGVAVAPGSLGALLIIGIEVVVLDDLDIEVVIRPPRPPLRHSPPQQSLALEVLQAPAMGSFPPHPWLFLPLLGLALDHLALFLPPTEDAVTLLLELGHLYGVFVHAVEPRVGESLLSRHPLLARETKHLFQEVEHFGSVFQLIVIANDVVPETPLVHALLLLVDQGVEGRQAGTGTLLQRPALLLDEFQLAGLVVPREERLVH